MKKLLLLSCLIGNTALAQVQPQFKFYLAFEDATGARDTVWVGLDENATSGADDPVFGDSLVSSDTAKFNVFFEFGWLDTLMQKTSIERATYSPPSHISLDVYGINYLYPLKIKWNKAILDNTAPFDFKQAFITNNSPFMFSYLYGYQLAGEPSCNMCDSVVLEPFTVGGGEGDHFPLSIVISEYNTTIGLQERQAPKVNLFPNPITDRFRINLKEDDRIDKIELTNETGQRLSKYLVVLENNLFDLSNLPAGIYFLTFYINNQVHHEKIIKT